uniref:Gypsy retrotransposon integrase-like protein 1 n=1 Tax=Acanthochromis polyacanthus TaxID=80966 RepID=A0A3Q1EWG8_9TELE
MSADSLPDSYTADEQFASFVVPQLSPSAIADKQRADPVLKHVIAQLETGESPPSSLREEVPELPLLLRDLNRLELQNNILVRRRQLGPQLQRQLVLPQECRADVLSSLHDQMGHMGIERTLDLIRNRFYWPRMANDVQTKVRTCERCIKRKALPEKAAPLVNIRTTHPLELVCIDFLTLEPDRSNTKDILVITDHFTKYAVAIPTPNQKARTVAKCLWENFFLHYGIPQKLHSDQGTDFESRTIKELCALTGIHKIRTTPYHPRGNPVERFNRTLLDMLGTLPEHEKSNWKDFVKPLVHAYNCTRNDTTGFTPYELMFGRQPRLPVDLAFGLPVCKPSQNHSDYVQKLRSHLEKSYQLASENASFGGRWTSVCEQAFEAIKEKLTSAPVLAFANPQKPYLLHTDASSIGLGAVLYQEQEGQKRVIAYASRGLSRSESRYPAHKLEFLALKWAVTEKFNDYLYGADFTVVTDSNPLTYLLTSAKLDATSYRWLAALSTYTFKIIYRAGKQNTDADGLSRRPHGGLTTDLMSQKEKERILR